MAGSSSQFWIARGIFVRVVRKRRLYVHKEARFKNSGLVQRHHSFDMIGMVLHIVGIDT